MDMDRLKILESNLLYICDVLMEHEIPLEQIPDNVQKRITETANELWGMRANSFKELLEILKFGIVICPIDNTILQERLSTTIENSLTHEQIDMLINHHIDGGSQCPTE